MTFLVTNQHESKPTLSQNKRDISVLFLGDSLTFGVGDQTKQQGYTGRTIKLLEQTFPEYHFSYENFGKPGDRSDQILQRLNHSRQQQAALKKADILVMTVGGNDLRQQLIHNVNARSTNSLSRSIAKSRQQYQQSLTALFERIHALKAKVAVFLFGNYNPIFVNSASRTDINRDVQSYNAVNQKLVAAQKDGHYVSIFRQMTFGQYQSKKQIKQLIRADEIYNGRLANPLQSSLLNGKTIINNDYISLDDHFHPNNLGYDYMSKELFNSIRKNTQWQKK